MKKKKVLQFNGVTWTVLTARSPEMLAPAKIPVAAGKKMENTEKNVFSPRKSGPMFSIIMAAEEEDEEIHGHEANVERENRQSSWWNDDNKQRDE